MVYLLFNTMDLHEFFCALVKLPLLYIINYIMLFLCMEYFSNLYLHA